MRKVIQLSFALFLTLSSVSHATDKSAAAKTDGKAQAVKTQSQDYVFPIADKVKLSASSYAQILDINLDSSDDFNMVSFAVKFVNNDNKVLPLIDYWVRAKSKNNGTVYTSAVITSDKTKTKVLANSSETVKFFSKVDKTVSLEDLKLEVVKWDFSSPDYTKKLGEVDIPKGFSYAAKPNQYKTSLINDIPIKMNINSFFKSSSGSSNLISISLQMKNIGKRTLTAPKYKYFIKSSSGVTYPLTVDSSQDLSLQPNEKKIIALGTTVPIDNGDDWIVQISQEDETAKVNIGVTAFFLQVTNANTANEEEKVVYIKNKKIGVQLKFANLVPNSDQSFNASISLTNRDNTSITLPKYSFVLQVDGGYSFPLTYKGNENTTLNPLQTTTYNVKGSIPDTINSTKAQLVVLQEVAAGNPTEPAVPSQQIPIAMYSFSNLAEINPMINTYIVDTKTGEYFLKLDSVQRLPWGESDIVSAHFKIKNPSTKSVTVPSLDGYMSLDGIPTPPADTKYVSLNSSMTMAPNSEIDGYLITKVPYFTQYNAVQIGMQEKLTEENKNDVAQFTSNNSSTDFPLIDINSGSTINIQGKSASVNLRNMNLYAGTGNSILYTEIELKNLESRQSNLSQMVAYFKSESGEYYKAAIEQSEQAIQTNGKSLVIAWAKIPRGTDPTKLKLLLGEGIKDNKLAAPKEEMTSFVDAKLYELPKIAGLTNTLYNMDFFPYYLSIKNFGVSLNKSSAVNVQMDYNLSKTIDYEYGNFGHKLLFQITDSSTGKVLEKEVNIESELSEGDRSYTFSLSDSIYEEKTYGTYLLKVFDVFQGQRREVASQGFYYSNHLS